MDSEDIKKGIEDAKTDAYSSNLIFWELLFFSIGAAIYAESWYVFPFTIIVLFIIITVPLFGKIFIWVCSLAWAIIAAYVLTYIISFMNLDPLETSNLSWREFLIRIFSTPPTQVVGFCVFMVMYLIHRGSSITNTAK